MPTNIPYPLSVDALLSKQARKLSDSDQDMAGESVTASTAADAVYFLEKLNSSPNAGGGQDQSNSDNGQENSSSTRGGSLSVATLTKEEKLKKKETAGRLAKETAGALSVMRIMAQRALMKTESGLVGTQQLSSQGGVDSSDSGNSHDTKNKANVLHAAMQGQGETGASGTRTGGFIAQLSGDGSPMDANMKQEANLKGVASPLGMQRGDGQKAMSTLGREDGSIAALSRIDKQGSQAEGATSSPAAKSEDDDIYALVDRIYRLRDAMNADGKSVVHVRLRTDSIMDLEDVHLLMRKKEKKAPMEIQFRTSSEKSFAWLKRNEHPLKEGIAKKLQENVLLSFARGKMLRGRTAFEEEIAE